MLRILKFEVLKGLPMQISTKSDELKVFFSEFHRKTNLVALLFSKLGSKNKIVSRISNFEVPKELPDGTFVW
jgi:hypothetical protein